MARYMIQNRISEPRALLDFSDEGYRYHPMPGDQDRPLFLRQSPNA